MHSFWELHISFNMLIKLILENYYYFFFFKGEPQINVINVFLKKKLQKCYDATVKLLRKQLGSLFLFSKLAPVAYLWSNQEI